MDLSTKMESDGMSLNKHLDNLMVHDCHSRATSPTKEQLETEENGNNLEQKLNEAKMKIQQLQWENRRLSEQNGALQEECTLYMKTCNTRRKKYKA